MAKTRYTKAEIVAFIKDLDSRATNLSDTKINNVINRAYAELMTMSKRLFSNEEIINLSEYYEASELNMTFDIEEDTNEVYDLYLTVEGDKDKAICQEIVQNVGIYRNNDILYRDNRSIGRVHCELDKENTIFDNVVIKYFYTPSASDEDVYMDSAVYLSFQDAIWAALNYFLKDVEGEAIKRASMQRTSKTATQEPEDLPSGGRSIFGGL